MTIRLLLLVLLSSSLFRTTPCTALGSTSTLAISRSTGTICAVLASNRTARCARGSDSFPLHPGAPAAAFTSVAGGRDFLCGLQSGPSGTPLFCRPIGLASSDTRTKRIYRGQPHLANLTVGDYHVAAAVPSAGGVLWWRGGGSGFPDFAAGAYRSLTSGNGFTCGVDEGSGRVRCWGTEAARGIEMGFTNVSMSTIEAGDSHACGITGVGELRCAGRNESGQLDAPADSVPFEFSALALGETHTCALRRANGTVVCWGGGARGSYYTPAGDTSFSLIVAGGDLTCGVDTGNFSVLCWRVPSPSNAVDVETIGSLGQVLPGICRSKTECRCGEFPGSGSLCGGTGDEVICSACDMDRDLPPSPPDSPPPAQPPTPGSGGRRRGKGFWVAVIVGSVGSFAGLLSILYCLWVGVCMRKKKVHNSVQPAILALSNGAPSLHGETAGNRFQRNKSSSTTLSGSSAKSFKSLVLRQGSRVMMRRQRSGPSRTASEYAEGTVKVFTFEELSAATKCFALDTKIGSGSFGTVYRGKLPDGREVAIKRRDQPAATAKEREIVQQDKEGEFQSELSFLSRLHHKHLVGLVGFCEEGDERLLVYDYMKNGSLNDHVHPKKPHNGKDHAGDPLGSWKMRIKVLLDASRGVDYLHNYAVPPIIHRDIKSSNILLDATWTAKVSDFGLSLSEPEPGVAAAPVKKAGTVGYIDPEYYGLHYLTVKSDVYGFGVVMLEVLTGKRAIFRDAEQGNLVYVTDYASEWIGRGDVSQVLDPRMPTPGPREVEAVERVAYTALLCVNLEAKERPTMTDVVANLEIALSLCEESQDNLSSASVSFTSMD